MNLNHISNDVKNTLWLTESWHPYEDKKKKPVQKADSSLEQTVAITLIKLALFY